MVRTLEIPTSAGPDAGLPAPVVLTDEERAALLDLARSAVTVAVRAAPESVIRAALERHSPLERRAAAFVTLTEDGELRGCVGHMDAQAPVAESVIEAANWAALGDPRFPSVRAAELPRLHLEVSVLGPLVRQEDPAGWRLGVDGIVVERGHRRGLLLPEVGPMLGNDRKAMLDTACRKAGLPPGAWRDPGTTLYAFRTDRFGGPVEASGSA
jgi:AmmeMemoRadiSam system protein A